MKLTATQVAARLNMNSYTIKRWYEFYNDLSEEEIEELSKEYGMPKLPKYETVGSRGDRVWDEDDIEIIRQFKDWVPPTRKGIFQKYKKEND